MTNKVNGIDVSECEFLECGMCNAQRNCDGYTGIECKYDNENCYYRQLKHLKQKNFELEESLKVFNKPDVKKVLTYYNCGEIDRLEQKIEAYELESQEAKEIVAELEYENKELKKENEELKQERLEVARLFDETCRCDDLQEDTAKCKYFNDDCISIRHCMKKFRSFKDGYKQALVKILDIAEKLITELPEYNSCYYKDECGDNCTPKKQSKVEYCCYENVDKILTIINEVLNDR